MNKRLMHAFGALNTWVYRISGGRFLGRFPSGAPVALLTTTGRRSGTPRTVPLLYLQDRDSYIVVASQGGAPTHPGWFLNLQAQPHADLQIGARHFTVSSSTLDDAEAKQAWPSLLAIYPTYETYRQRTTRRIPLVRLTPASEQNDIQPGRTQR